LYNAVKGIGQTMHTRSVVEHCVHGTHETLTQRCKVSQSWRSVLALICHLSTAAAVTGVDSVLTHYSSAAEYYLLL